LPDQHWGRILVKVTQPFTGAHRILTASKRNSANNADLHWTWMVGEGDTPTFQIFRAHRPDNNGSPTFIYPLQIGWNGNVGIGASPNQNHRLYVHGDLGVKLVQACRIEVEAHQWCDYVFEPDYKLMPIEEFSKFIKVNKHLPGMPSEKEVIEKGIDVFEMFKMQQKVIEEYGLYIKLLNERISQLENIQK
jgi:hypothetical protein